MVQAFLRQHNLITFYVGYFIFALFGQDRIEVLMFGNPLAGTKVFSEVRLTS